MKSIINRAFFADKAYCDEDLDIALAANNSIIMTPIKLIKGQTTEIRQWIKAADDLFSTAVSRVRQPIESFFGWVIEKTDIQRASKGRSSKGLIVHVFGKLSAALLNWFF